MSNEEVKKRERESQEQLLLDISCAVDCAFEEAGDNRANRDEAIQLLTSALKAERERMLEFLNSLPVRTSLGEAIRALAQQVPGGGMAWRTKEKCIDCPFATIGPGRKLRGTLMRGRWKEILASLRRDEAFPCHRTTEHDEDGDYIRGTGLLCAGALEWQEKHNGQPGQLARIMERLSR